MDWVSALINGRDVSENDYLRKFVYKHIQESASCWSTWSVDERIANLRTLISPYVANDEYLRSIATEPGFT
jgi:hypothetical protein